MSPESNVRQPSIWGLLSTTLLFIVITVYAVISLNTGDLLWFWPRFENQPTSILVHCYGEDVEITTASQNFDPLTDMINHTLSGEKRWDPLSLSQTTYEEYRTSPSMLTMEVNFSEAVRIHTQTAYFSNVDILVIPLDARHSTYNTLFGRTQDGNLAAGSLHVDSLDELRAYLYTHAICHLPSNSQSDQQLDLTE